MKERFLQKAENSGTEGGFKAKEVLSKFKVEESFRSLIFSDFAIRVYGKIDMKSATQLLLFFVDKL